MFVQATKSRRQNKTYVSFLVRESFRTSEGPRSRTVCNISALPPEVRELVAAALSGQTCVVLEQIELSHALDYGGLAVLRDAWQRFGLEKLFADVPQVRQRRLLQAMIFGRILFPGAKLALGERASGTLLAAACGLGQQSEPFDEDNLYEAMDALNGRWVPIERRANATSLLAESIDKNAISPGARLAWKKPKGNSSAWRPSGAKNPIRKNWPVKLAASSNS